jgi:hypothetical protein
MWWPPETDNERFVSETLSRLNEYFLTPRLTIPGVHAVGSTVDGSGRRVPLLVVDRSLAPRRRVGLLELYFGLGLEFLSDAVLLPLELVTRLSRLLLPLNLLLRFNRGFLPLARMWRAHVFTSLPEAGPKMLELLSRWQVPESTQLLFSPPPIALGANPGAPILARSSRDEEGGTLGFQLLVGQHAVFSTAGHVVPAGSDTVLTFTRSGWPFRRFRFEEIGMVTFSNDPTDPVPGVDVAIVEPLHQHLPASNAPAKLAYAPNVRDGSGVVLLGGRSEVQFGWIFGALVSAKSLDGRVWKNCWQIVGSVSSGFAQPGDSGGPVVLSATSDALGHLVAVQGGIERSGRFQGAVVQDISTMVEYLVQNYGKGPVIVLNEGLPPFPRS